MHSDNCSILHVDMDAFFASVEVRDNSDLAGKPVVVGHDARRGVVVSATYEARAFGVRAAMPVARAMQLIPNAVLVKPRMAAYQIASKEVMQIFESITPLVQPLSLDEAFLDVSGARHLFGAPEEIGALIRKRVRDEVGLSCSVGIASTMFLAKLATNHAKPNGMYCLSDDAVLDFLHPLPISAMWGVGPKTGEALQRIGIHTVGDLARLSVKTLSYAVGQAAAVHLSELAWGRDPRVVQRETVEKSIGAETTFHQDLDDSELIEMQLLELSEQVARRLRNSGRTAKTVTVKIRLADFTTITRSKSPSARVESSQVVYDLARQLFRELALNSTRVRLVGVRLTGLQESQQNPEQLTFDSRLEMWRDVEFALDKVAEKYGDSAVRPARLIQFEMNNSSDFHKSETRRMVESD